MNNEVNAVVPQGFFMDENHDFVADLSSRQTAYCSLKGETDEEKAIMFNLVNNPEKRVADMINMTINVKDLFVETVTCVNEKTGEQNQAPRIVMIDDKGVGYQAVSLGVFGALKKIFALYGSPDTWKKPLPIAVKQKKKGEKNILTFEIDTTPAKK